DGTDDVTGRSPELGPLQTWYAIGPTHRPAVTSPVLEAGRPDCSGVDAQGIARPIDSDGDGTARCEIGAVEAGMIGDLAFAVDTTVTDPDAFPGDGVCQTATGACSLPAALA